MPNRKERYSDMEKYLKTRNAQRKRYYRKTAKYGWRLWTKEEDERVLAHDISDTKLSKEIMRSVQSIQMRRCNLKKMINITQDQK